MLEGEEYITLDKNVEVEKEEVNVEKANPFAHFVESDNEDSKSESNGSEPKI